MLRGLSGSRKTSIYEQRKFWKIHMLGIYGETMVFQRLKNQGEMSILRTEKLP